MFTFWYIVDVLSHYSGNTVVVTYHVEGRKLSNVRPKKSLIHVVYASYLNK